MNKLDHTVTSKIKDKYQCNDAIEYEPRFDNKISLSSGTKDPIQVVTVRLRGGKKHRSTIIYGLSCLWYSISTDMMIKSRHTKPYERKISSNELEYSTYAGPYCKTHDIKVPFYMTEFSIRNIILYCFHIDNNKGESGIGYDIIIGLDLMVQLGL